MSNNNEEYDGYGEDDASYENVGDQQQEEELVPVETVFEHVKGEDLCQEKFVNLVLYMHCTPTEATKTPSLCKSSFAAHVQKGFHTVTSINNRVNPSKEDLEGDLDKMVVTSLKCTGYNNGCSKVVYAHVNGHAPTTLTPNGRCSLVMEPNHCQMNLDIDLHSPASIMTRNMLKLYQRCDETVLEREFQVVIDPETGRKDNIVFMKGAAAGILSRHPNLYNGFRADTPYINSPNCKFSYISPELCERLYKNMSKSIKEVNDSFISTKDLGVKFTVDSTWDDISSFVGDTVTVPPESAIEHSAQVLSSPMRVAVHLRLGYTTAVPVFGSEKK